MSNLKKSTLLSKILFSSIGLLSLNCPPLQASLQPLTEDITSSSVLTQPLGLSQTDAAGADEISRLSLIDQSCFADRISLIDLSRHNIKKIAHYLTFRRIIIVGMTCQRMNEIADQYLAGIFDKHPLSINWKRKIDKKYFPHIWKYISKLAQLNNFLPSLSLNSLDGIANKEQNKKIYPLGDLKVFYINNYNFRYLGALKLTNIKPKNLKEMIKLDLPHLRELEFSMGYEPKAKNSKMGINPMQYPKYYLAWLDLSSKTLEEINLTDTFHSLSHIKISVKRNPRLKRIRGSRSKMIIDPTVGFDYNVIAKHFNKFRPYFSWDTEISGDKIIYFPNATNPLIKEIYQLTKNRVVHLECAEDRTNFK